MFSERNAPAPAGRAGMCDCFLETISYATDTLVKVHGLEQAFAFVWHVWLRTDGPLNTQEQRLALNTLQDYCGRLEKNTGVGRELAGLLLLGTEE